MSGKFEIWKHDCIKHGSGVGDPCDPPCNDPWEVDSPPGTYWGDDARPSFPTFSEAINYASRVSRTGENLCAHTSAERTSQ